MPEYAAVRFGSINALILEAHWLRLLSLTAAVRRDWVHVRMGARSLFFHRRFRRGLLCGVSV